MTLPIPAPEPGPEPLVIIDRQGADDFTALGHAMAAHHAAHRPVSVVYAPTTITHHHPAPAPGGVPAPRPAGPAHPGLDVDLRGYGVFVPPARVEPLPRVPETRTLAPLAFLLSCWATALAGLASAATGGNPAALGATACAITAGAGSFAALYRSRS